MIEGALVAVAHVHDLQQVTWTQVPSLGVGDIDLLVMYAAGATTRLLVPVITVIMQDGFENLELRRILT